jgi:hypothetical protein
MGVNNPDKPDKEKDDIMKELSLNGDENPLPETGFDNLLERGKSTTSRRRLLSRRLSPGKTGRVGLTRRIDGGEEDPEEHKKRIEKIRIESAMPERLTEVMSKGAPRIEVLDESSHLFCDQTNFTGLSELMKKIYGRESGQKINELINEAISASIDEVTALGGDVVQFGGDAIQVLFTGPKHDERATLAAIMIQRSLQDRLEEYHTDPIKLGRNIHHYLLPPGKENEKENEKTKRNFRRNRQRYARRYE